MNERGSDPWEDPGKGIPGEENIRCKGLKRPVGEMSVLAPETRGWESSREWDKAAGTDYVKLLSHHFLIFE